MTVFLRLLVVLTCAYYALVFYAWHYGGGGIPPRFVLIYFPAAIWLFIFALAWAFGAFRRSAR